MKKLLVGLFVFGFLSIGVQQVHASLLSDTLLKIQNLERQISQLKIGLKGSVYDVPEAPTLGSVTVSNITPTGATISSSVASLGFPPLLTQRGVCYGTVAAEGPMAHCINTGGSVIGAFSQSITGLTPNTRYAVVSYAVNGTAPSYSNSVEFTTADSPILAIPTVASPVAQNITTTSATLSATVTNNGSPSTLTERGICYLSNLSYIPIKSSGATCITATSSQLMISAMGLTPNTTYKYKAYAQNSSGIGYSEDGTFTTKAEAVVVVNNYVPTVVSPTAQNITQTSAILGATLTDMGSPASITYRGVCYEAPSIAGSGQCLNSTSAQIMISATNLVPNTAYKYRGFATNSTGNGYSEYGTFTTLPTQTNNSTVAPSVTVLSPNGGESYTAGQQITVTWKSENIPATESVLIEMTQANPINNPFGGWITLLGSTPNDGIQTITLNSNLSPGKYELAIRRNLGNAEGDISNDTFTINSAQQTTGTLLGVTISGTAQVGQTLRAVLSPVGANATYSWLRKNTLGYTSSISGATSSSYTLTNDDVGSQIFVIAKGTNGYTGGESGDIRANTSAVLPLSSTASKITVLSPNGGETFQAGQTITVKWKTENIGSNGNFSIDLHGAKNSYSLAMYTANDGEEIVTLPSDLNGVGYLGNKFLISVGIKTFETPIDYSDNYFTINSLQDVGCVSGVTISPVTGKVCPGVVSPIIGTPSITVLSPNGGIYNPGQEIIVGFKTQGLKTSDGLSFYLVKKYKSTGMYSTSGAKFGQSYSNTGGEEKFTTKIPSNSPILDNANNDYYAIAIIGPDGDLLTGKGTIGYSNPFIINSSTAGICPTNVPSVTCPPYQTEIIKDASGCVVKYQCMGASKNADISTDNPAGNTNNVDAEDLAKISRTLKRGTIGDDVKILQAFLGIDADGVFGRGTANKVKAWQAEHNIRADGLFGRGSLMTATADLQ